MKYSDIICEFKKECGVSDELISDIRPCCQDYGYPFIENAIIVWLKSGSTIIYQHKKQKS